MDAGAVRGSRIRGICSRQHWHMRRDQLANGVFRIFLARMGRELWKGPFEVRDVFLRKIRLKPGVGRERLTTRCTAHAFKHGQCRNYKDMMRCCQWRKI